MAGRPRSGSRNPPRPTPSRTPGCDVRTTSLSIERGSSSYTSRRSRTKYVVNTKEVRRRKDRTYITPRESSFSPNPLPPTLPPLTRPPAETSEKVSTVLGTPGEGSAGHFRARNSGVSTGNKAAKRWKQIFHPPTPLPPQSAFWAGSRPSFRFWCNRVGCREMASLAIACASEYVGGSLREAFA
jgi:hypothetical protein